MAFGLCVELISLIYICGEKQTRMMLSRELYMSVCVKLKNKTDAELVESRDYLESALDRFLC